MKSNTEIINVEYILGKLYDILENEEVSTKDKLAAIRMCGEWLKMFEDQKRVQIDIRGLIGQLTNKQLAGFIDGRSAICDAEIIAQECIDSPTPSGPNLLAGGNLPDSPSEHGVHSGSSGKGGEARVDSDGSVLDQN